MCVAYNSFANTKYMNTMFIVKENSFFGRI
jgi:hypothetical protein